MIKKMFTLLIAVLFVVPFIAAADDFDDDFGGDEEEESESEEEEEEAPAKVKGESESDAAMRDLMGEPEVKPAPKKQITVENVTAENVNYDESETTEGVLPKGLKPVMVVKGSFAAFASYGYSKKGDTKTYNNSEIFGSLDEGILGLEYAGEHVIAKGTVNLRTSNPFIGYIDKNEANGYNPDDKYDTKKTPKYGIFNNPLIKNNLHSIQDGAANAIYEVYGGIKFYDVFIKAGNMIPEYGLIDGYQELGMGFATPFLTRSLVVVEGFIPETDAGIGLGYNGVIMDDHNVFAGLSVGTGSNKSEFWDYEKTIGVYGRIGYGFKNLIKAAVSVQYRTDYDSDRSAKTKKLGLTGIGVHLKGGYAGFEMPLSVDINFIDMVGTDKSNNEKKKTKTGILFSAAPGYGYDLSNHVDWLDKVAIAVRFDLVKGIFAEEKNLTDYLEKAADFKQNELYFRIGATANVFTKEFGGVRGMTGLTFLMQPESNNGKKGTNKKVYQHGFTTLVLQAGAEF